MEKLIKTFWFKFLGCILLAFGFVIISLLIIGGAISFIDWSFATVINVISNSEFWRGMIVISIFGGFFMASKWHLDDIDNID